MKLKLFKKYFFTTSLIIVFSLGIMMMILSFVLNNYIAKTKHETLVKCCDEITDYVSGVFNSEADIDIDGLSGLVGSLSDVADTDVFVTDENGKVIVCGCAQWQEQGSCIHSSSVISFAEFSGTNTENGVGLSTLGIYRNAHYVAAKPLYDDENVMYGAVYSTASVSTVSNLLSTVVKLYIASAVLPILLLFVSIYTMTYRITKPLKSMSEASKAMARGDVSRRIPVMSDDEIGELSMSFNMMTNNLAQLEGMRRSFVANVSHELKTPMTTIGGFIDGILDGTIEQEKQQYYLNIVSDEVKRLSRLVQSMLSMARLESGEFVLKPELFDLRELLYTIVISQEQRIEKLGLNIEGLEELQNISVNADKDLIHQVIYNLVDNAIKFNCENGKISFSLKTEGKKAVFTITNTGKGIPEKELPFVFERFYKVDKSRSASKNSTGLGLYIVKTIVTAHGGTITVAGRENCFTSFTVVLPAE